MKKLRNALAPAAAALLVLASGGSITHAQTPPIPVASKSAPPVIDAHWHFPGKENYDSTVKAMKELNVAYAVAIGTEIALRDVRITTDVQLVPSLTFPCENGKMVNSGAQCFDNGVAFPDISKLRESIVKGEVKVFGEINAQYLGIAPNDPRLDPYYALAEEMDVPIGIHLGIAAPGVAYNRPGFPPVKSPNYRGAAGEPFLLEDVLLRHPKLRLYVMHAAYPMGDQMIYMLYMHPQLYVDISVLQWAIPRPAYYAYLRRLVETGFAKRIMFGSDGNATRLKEGIQAIMDADFLSSEQKADILFNNAFSFFRLGRSGPEIKK